MMIYSHQISKLLISPVCVQNVLRAQGRGFILAFLTSGSCLRSRIFHLLLLSLGRGADVQGKKEPSAQSQ